MSLSSSRGVQYTGLNQTHTTEMQAYAAKYTVLVAEMKSDINVLATKLHTSLNSSLTQLQKATVESETKVAQLLTEASSRMTQAEGSHEARLAAQLKEFSIKGQESLAKTTDAFTDSLNILSGAAETVINKNDAETKKLISELEELEGRISHSIERATGHSLFHSFQTRQEAIAKSKRFWAIALGALVGISLIASAGFIWSLSS